MYFDPFEFTKSILRYIIEKLFAGQSEEAFNNCKAQMKKIRSLVKKASAPPQPEEIGRLKGKLEKCRNPGLADDRLIEFVDDEDDTISVPVETVAAFGNEFDALDF